MPVENSGFLKYRWGYDTTKTARRGCHPKSIGSARDSMERKASGFKSLASRKIFQDFVQLTMSIKRIIKLKTGFYSLFFGVKNNKISVTFTYVDTKIVVVHTMLLLKSFACDFKNVPGTISLVRCGVKAPSYSPISTRHEEETSRRVL